MFEWQCSFFYRWAVGGGGRVRIGLLHTTDKNSHWKRKRCERNVYGPVLCVRKYLVSTRLEVGAMSRPFTAGRTHF
jgi:hypothetical protein